MKFLKSFLVFMIVSGLVLQAGTVARADDIPAERAIGADAENLTGSAAAEDTAVSADEDVLKQFFTALSAETKSEEVEALAKEYGLYAFYRNYGTGSYGYRIAASEAVADPTVKAKGSYVSISFYILQDDAVTEISCFDMAAMTEAFWYPDGGYFVVDYNVPQLVFRTVREAENEGRSCMAPVASAAEAVSYVSSGSPEGNLLAQLFLSAHEGMSEEEILRFVSDNDLAYSPNGPGNFKTIAYTEDVAEKYGKNGSVITYDTDEAGLIWMQYSYYPSYFRLDISAAFYSRAYAASQKLDEGFLLCRTGSKPAQYKDAVRLIGLIHG